MVSFAHSACAAQVHDCDLAQEQTLNEQLQKALQEETNLKEEVLNLLAEESVLKQTSLANLERERAINTELRTQAADGVAQIQQRGVALAASEAQLAKYQAQLEAASAEQTGIASEIVTEAAGKEHGAMSMAVADKLRLQLNECQSQLVQDGALEQQLEQLEAARATHQVEMNNNLAIIENLTNELRNRDMQLSELMAEAADRQKQFQEVIAAGEDRTQQWNQRTVNAQRTAHPAQLVELLEAAGAELQFEAEQFVKGWQSVCEESAADDAARNIASLLEEELVALWVNKVKQTIMCHFTTAGEMKATEAPATVEEIQVTPNKQAGPAGSETTVEAAEDEAATLREQQELQRELQQELQQELHQQPASVSPSAGPTAAGRILTTVMGCPPALSIALTLLCYTWHPGCILAAAASSHSLWSLECAWVD